MVQQRVACKWFSAVQGSLTDGTATLSRGAIDRCCNVTASGTVQYGSSDGSITITASVDEDNMASNSATLFKHSKSLKHTLTHN